LQPSGNLSVWFGWFSDGLPFGKTMATISIAIVSCSNEIATLKVLRSYSSAPIGELRRLIGSHEAALVLSTLDYSIELDPEKGERQQQRRIIEACDRLEQAGAVLELGNAPTRDDPFEVINRAGMMNLFESDIELGIQTEALADLESGEPCIETLEWLKGDRPDDVFLQTLKQIVAGDGYACDEETVAWARRELAATDGKKGTS
jgi:hypothetical protein